MDKSGIAILTTVANFELYSKTSQLHPEGIKKYVIDGTNGMHGINSILYMFKVLKNKEIEWLIMADEDVIFQDSDEVFHIIDYMKTNNITVCGIRDGGIIPHRGFNPYVINTFFSILNFKKLSSIFDKNTILQNQYIISDEFSDDLDNLPFKYDKQSLYEPYYSFYFWLRRNGEKFLFLEANVPFKEDSITNSIVGISGKPFAFHTWHARSYGVNIKHTRRIDKVLSSDFFDNNRVNNDHEVFKDRYFSLTQKVKKFIRRVELKLGFK